MIPYLISFMLCVFFLFLWKKTSEKHKKLSRFFIVIALSIPALLSAFRSYSVGVDTLVYQKPFFDIAKNYSSFTSYLGTQNTSSEVLYHLTTWISARYFSIQTLFFLLQILTIVPIFIALNRTKNKNIVIIGILFYLLFAFNESLNMARQSIALSFSVLAISQLIDRKYIKTIIAAIVAILFHSSAYMIIPVCALVMTLTSKLNKKTKTLFSLFIIIATFLITTYLLNIIGALSTFSESEVLNKYANYSNRFESVGFNIPLFAIWLIILLVTIAFTKASSKNDTRSLYILMSTLYLASFFANTIIHYSNRAFYYFSYPAIIYLLPKTILEHTGIKNTKPLTLILTFILLAQWILQNVYWNYNNTTPYILGNY